MLKGSLLCFQKVNYTLAFITSIAFGNVFEVNLRKKALQIGHLTQEYIDGITVASYGTQLSAINYSQKVDGKDVILLSTPTASSGRRAGKILVGVITDTGNTGYDRYTVSWDYQYEIDLADYGFSYSCMTELPDHRIGILYEKYDSWSRNELHLKDIMKYDIFTISELTASSNAG